MLLMPINMSKKQRPHANRLSSTLGWTNRLVVGHLGWLLWRDTSCVVAQLRVRAQTSTANQSRLADVWMRPKGALVEWIQYRNRLSVAIEVFLWCDVLAFFECLLVYNDSIESTYSFRFSVIGLLHIADLRFPRHYNRLSFINTMHNVDKTTYSARQALLGIAMSVCISVYCALVLHQNDLSEFFTDGQPQDSSFFLRNEVHSEIRKDSSRTRALDESRLRSCDFRP